MTASPAEGPASPPSAGLATAALRGLGWRFASEFGGKGMVLVSTIVLARLLDRDDFGVAAYALTLMALFGAVPSLGLGPALIYHADDERYRSTGFWIGLAAALAGTAIVWVLAPLSEHLFGDPRAVDVTRGMGLIFPIEALSNVHGAILRKRLSFRIGVVPELTRSFSKGIASIVLALAGFGAWALIGGTLFGALAAMPVYWIVLRWRPRLLFDRTAAAALIPFGGHLAAVNTLGAAVRNLDYVIVGRVLGAAALGTYTLAFRLPDLLIRNLVAVLGQVLLPIYSKLREDRAPVGAAFATTTAYVVAVTAPMAVGLALLAEPTVIVAFSVKWIDVVPIIPPICFYALFVSISFNIGDLYKALGHPGVLTRLGLVRLVLAVPALWVAATAYGSAAAVGWAQAGIALAMMAIELVVARIKFRLPVGAALAGTAPVLAASGAMALAVHAVSAPLETEPAWIQLALGIATGALVYSLALWLFARQFVTTGLSVLRVALDRRAPSFEGART
jgi:O-antigen/teichoic acid export membrane protein